MSTSNPPSTLEDRRQVNGSSLPKNKLCHDMIQLVAQMILLGFTFAMVLYH